MIGKTYVSQNSGQLNFILTINNIEYKFNEKTITHSVSDTYDFRHNDDNWDLILYSNGVINFKTIKTSVDFCAVGGGGAGGGSTGANPLAAGGNGGGGVYTEQSNININTKQNCIINIGAGGTANGGRGGTTSLIYQTDNITIVTAAGGGGGSTGEGRTEEDQGSPHTAQCYCFNDSAYPTVCGPTARSESVSYYRGAGGTGGVRLSNQWNKGTNGRPGLLIIRNHRS